MASMTCCYAWVHRQAAAWFTSSLLLLFPTCSLSAGRALQLCLQWNSKQTSNVWNSFQKDKRKRVLKASPPGGICPLTAAAPQCLQRGANCTTVLLNDESSVSALKLKGWDSISVAKLRTFQPTPDASTSSVRNLLPPPGSEWWGVWWEGHLSKEGSWKALGGWWDAAQGPKVIKGISGGLTVGGGWRREWLGSPSWISRGFPETGKKGLWRFFSYLFKGWDILKLNFDVGRSWAVVSCISSVGCEGGQDVCTRSWVCICC